MIIQNNDGTVTVGPLDVICILQHEETRVFHPAFFEEHPFPGPVPPANEVEVVRLKSKMHRTTGLTTWDEAMAEVTEMRSKIKIEDRNVWIESPFAWDGEIGIVWTMENWRKQ